MKKVGFTVSGWIIIGLGIAGLALPFIPGVVLIVLGLVILSSHYVWAQGALAWLRRRFPKTLQFADLQLASLRQRFTSSWQACGSGSPRAKHLEHRSEQNHALLRNAVATSENCCE
jgi:Putative transmembrane protein (PGPGW)